MRGYFAIGVEGSSKPGNMGNLMRSAHGFGASFVFAISPALDTRELHLVDTSDTAASVPFYTFPDPAKLVLPHDCTLVGVELLDDAVDLPSFRHPLRAAYVLGPERGALSSALVARCQFVVKIPTRFCINVGVAGALVMYDRMISLGRWAERPVRVGGPAEAAAVHIHGRQKIRDRRRQRGVPTPALDPVSS
jgi:tRNA G18 (ribose-2'-O)-methylase SpoU